MRYYFYSVVELLKLLWQWLPHDGVINMLLRRKPYANKFFTGELLTLATAIKGRNRAKIRRLAQQLPNIDACGRDSVTPLLFDVPDRQDSNAIEVLLDYGANVNVTDKFGQTPLFDMLHVQFDNALLCLQRGADVHQMSDRGVTIPYIVQQALAEMDATSPVYRTMLAIKRLVVDKGGRAISSVDSLWRARAAQHRFLRTTARLSPRV